MKQKLVLFLLMCWMIVQMTGCTSCSQSDPATGDDDADAGTPDGDDGGAPSAHPYIVFTMFDKAKESEYFTEFKGYIDDIVVEGRNEDWGYTSANAVILAYVLRADSAQHVKYCQHAINRVDAWVEKAYADIADGEEPDIAYDDYIHDARDLEELSFAYDHCHDLLTSMQRDRWKKFGDQAVYNIWHHQTATWGGKLFSWNGWGTDLKDPGPGNNYFFYHIAGTAYWALATQNKDWIKFLTETRFPAVETYYSVEGGGSREGTGYGPAQETLFELAAIWKASRPGTDLDGLTQHIRDEIAYMFHATMPNFEEFAPYGDLASGSGAWPTIREVQLSLMRWAMHSARTSPEARLGQWWLQKMSVTPSKYGQRPFLLSLSDIQIASPTVKTHYSKLTGEYFVRSSWTDPNACWAGFKAGIYDQSHAHQDQGSFTIFCEGKFLAVTPNVLSHSGLQGANYGVYRNPADNTLRFLKSNDSLDFIRQSWFTDGFNSSMAITPGTGGDVTIDAELKNAYHDNRTLVSDWTRTFSYSYSSSKKQVRIIDTCSAAQSVIPIFQVNTLVKPVLNSSDGSITAGRLIIKPGPNTTATFVDMETVPDLKNNPSDPPHYDFDGGWRIELRRTMTPACSFSVDFILP